MFERFSLNARMAVVQAQAQARELKHPWIGPEHLLIGIVTQENAPHALTRRGITVETCRKALITTVGGGAGLSDEDAAELLKNGFPVPGHPLAPPEPKRGLFGRRKPEPAPGLLTLEQALAQHIPFTVSGHRALRTSAEVPVEQEGDMIALPHLTYAVADPGNAVIDRMFGFLGTDTVTVRTEVLAELKELLAVWPDLTKKD
ncbi:Clp protease N-terminal domain-containing protein [Streptomyces sp. UNOC14_S4]|uniref:Clp protease N-terminal domain-containing protein n=1 Tax=Streptomyces sp. UNOC14_S4 TaxID=2872340 RepID=UPI001E4BE445|nr:Clp protease N-terminal domain-containing protein [Streptomyces sp. UNOC14_S4]MCC3768133.1 hypothetical protein [Streptomyces sp. UNOC14_S4]